MAGEYSSSGQCLVELLEEEAEEEHMGPFQKMVGHLEEEEVGEEEEEERGWTGQHQQGLNHRKS